MTKQGDQPIKIIPVKENVVEGVLKTYLDQLLVTATSPQKIEKSILIPEIAAPHHDEDQPSVKAIEIPVELEAAITEKIPVADTLAQVELISVSSITPIEAVEEEPVLTESHEEIAEVETKSVVDQTLSSLIDQESWSSQGVECLVFSVGGLKLAVPLLLLGGVHEIESSDVKPLMGQPKWYLGMVHRNEINLQVIDTANFIMPERTQSLADQDYKYLIQLEKTPWTIACQSIDDTVRLEATEIKWRGDRGKRAWLAGTVIEKMCALIDVSGLLQQVESSCKSV